MGVVAFYSVFGQAWQAPGQLAGKEFMREVACFRFGFKCLPKREKSIRSFTRYQFSTPGRRAKFRTACCTSTEYMQLSQVLRSNNKNVLALLSRVPLNDLFIRPKLVELATYIPVPSSAFIGYRLPNQRATNVFLSVKGINL